MTNHSKTSAKIEENLYQILDVPNTANLAQIRQAYEGKLEETHLEAFAAYSLLPEEETEEKLLQFSHAYITLANPIARAKYDDELNQPNIPAKKKSDLPKVRAKKAKESTTKIPECCLEYFHFLLTISDNDPVFPSVFVPQQLGLHFLKP